MHPPKITIFDSSNPLHRTAQALFESVKSVPLICPHGHVNPGLFSRPGVRFTNPAALFILPDHYVLRVLVSQGYSFEELGIFPLGAENPYYDPLGVWQVFCENFSCFDGTPTGLWIQNELAMVFGIYTKPDAYNAGNIFKQIQDALAKEAYSPRNLFERFNIETLCTTDAPDKPLESHKAIKACEWNGKVRPTFRADKIIDIGSPDWPGRLESLGEIIGKEITTYQDYLSAIQERREQFKALGAIATDHSVEQPYTCRLTTDEAGRYFQKGLKQGITPGEVKQFTGHMIIEMAKMSMEDGLVMQLRGGPFRNHNPHVFETYGPDRGFDLPVSVEWTRNLKPLLDTCGLDPRLRIILFSLDESCYSRELAPMAGVYPSIKLGPPWWFYDSPNGMMRYFDTVMESAGFENTVGFNDDTSAFLSIPARHDLWRRMSALWLAKLVHQGQLDQPGAEHRMLDLAYRLAKTGYKLD
ncbi:MAG: glucuronate isomerase [Brevefilum sp.]